MKANCYFCGKEFDCSGAEKYCSIECRKDARRERENSTSLVPKICPNCNTSFIPENRSDQVYCSLECRTGAKAKRKNMELSERTCVVCGDTFMPVQNKQICCGEECVKKRWYSLNSERKRQRAKEWRQNNLERARENDRLKREHNKDRYKQYDLEYHDQTRFGGNRQKALERDGYKCVVCGETEGIGVHHKDFSGQTDKPNNELDNLMTVCKSCHTNIHVPRLDTTPHVMTACEHCGIEFRVSQARIDDGRGKFCSKKCFNKSMVNKATITCQHCGNPFDVLPSRIKRGKVKYCSMECRKAAGYATRKK